MLDEMFLFIMRCGAYKIFLNPFFIHIAFITIIMRFGAIVWLLRFGAFYPRLDARLLPLISACGCACALAARNAMYARLPRGCDVCACACGLDSTAVTVQRMERILRESIFTQK